MNICKCGCNQECNNIWVKGHNGKGKTFSEEVKQRISKGNRGKTFSQEHKQKTRESNLGKTHSEEAKQKMSESKVGNKYNLGRIHSEETKQKMRESNLGQTRSEEVKQKMSESKVGNKHSLGKVHSEETRKKIGESLKGKTFSEETKQKMSEASKGKIFSEETKQKLKGRKPSNPYGRSKWIPYMECDLSISKMPTYEYHTRLYLDSIGESYIWCAKGNYPEHIIRLSNGTAYYPDFYLPRLKIYIDPKGFWQDLEKKALVEEEYPELCYHFLGKTYLGLIKEFIQKTYMQQLQEQLNNV